MLNDNLKAWAIEWEHNKDYKQDAMPEVYAYYKQYIETGKFPYLDSVVEFITKSEPVNDLEALKTQVYIASKQYRQERDNAHKAKMLADGWLILNTEATTKLNGKKVNVSADGQGAIFSFKLSDIFKVFVDDKGYAYLMKPRATRKGYLISNLENVFYKLA